MRHIPNRIYSLGSYLYLEETRDVSEKLKMADECELS